MYINDRDQVNYHGFLRALRERQGASTKQVAEGICSDSEVYRTEIGDRLPEKLMRDRITSRLGVSGEEYEEYLRPEEYRQWEIRMFILEHINKGNADEVQKGIEEYDKIPDKNPVMEQFIDTMRYMLAQMNDAPIEMLRARIELAIAHTVPDIPSAFKGVQLLADQELNLIVEYTHIREYFGREDEFQWRLDEYLKVLKYMDTSYMDPMARSKVYPRVTCYICDLVLNQSQKKRHLEFAYELCVKTIQLLQETGRLYYFVELLEYRKTIALCLLKYKISTARKAELDEVYQKDSEWEAVLKKVYNEYKVPVYMHDFTYLYVETECNSAVEVIRNRRTMQKISRLKVSDNICTEKTVERFENYVNSPSIVVIRDIFERIGLCAEYRRSRVVTDNPEMLRLYEKVVRSINYYQFEQCENYLDELKANLHMDIAYNKQVIEGVYNLLAYLRQEIDVEEFTENAVKTLEYTVPMSAIARSGKKYLTREELICLYDMAFRGVGEAKMYGIAMVANFCSTLKEDHVEVARLVVYEMLISALSSYVGDLGRYKESTQLSEKVLKLSLTHRRMSNLTNNLYNKLWNSQKMDLIDDNIYVEKIQACLSMSEITDNVDWIQFLQKKLNEKNP